MELEFGKFYRTANGLKVGPARHTTNGSSYDWTLTLGTDTLLAYTQAGSAHGNPAFDIVAEWSDPHQYIVTEPDPALLLAQQDGMVIEYWNGARWAKVSDPSWFNATALRIRPQDAADQGEHWGS